MLYRKIDKRIMDWLGSSRGALLVSGARQVGKTFSIREALISFDADYIELNLLDEPELVPLLEQISSIDDLIVNISAATGRSLVKGETIVFIDEVQEAKELYTRIKFWVDDGSFRFILSGSLLGIELNDVRSIPVGYVDEITMFPLDFEEFMIASGVTYETIAHLKECFDKRESVGDYIHHKMMKLFYRYAVVGGMPAAVEEYIGSGDMNKVSEIHRNIISQYKRDFTKYERKDKKLLLQAIYDTIPANLLKQNKRFNYSDIRKGLHFEKTEDSFIWLEAAGVIIPAYNTTEPRLSLSQNMKSSLVKLYSSDVGLLTYQYGNATRIKILSMADNINMGGIFENAVAQELNTHGFKAFFYNSHKQGELDFVLESGMEVIPIEVKSGKDYYVHSALNNVLLNNEYAINEAFVFANCDISVQGKIIYMPIYMCTFISDDMELPILDPVFN